MAMASEIDTTPDVVGLLPDGVKEDVAAKIAKRVQETVEKISHGFTVRSVRMVPSSVIHLDDGAIQFIANATVVPCGASRPARAKVVDSVVTLGLGDIATIRGVRVPFLEGKAA